MPPMNQIVLAERRTTSYLRTVAALSLFAGSDMIVSAFTAHGMFPTLLGGVVGSATNSLAWDALNLGSLLISLFIGLSGAFFVAGGLILLIKRRSFGRGLVALAGGIGIFSLIFSLAASYIELGSFTSSFLQYYVYWIGIVLGIVTVGIEMEA
ncbi:MAG TPA: hypothetical protein VFF30_05055 [Nitrososphaerales archaeon]|nr:hypothetical protein [Nitrososphaerales archaeon]